MTDTTQPSTLAQSGLARGGRLLLTAMRLYLGAWMLVNGLNHWIPIFPQPYGGSPLSQLFITSLVDTHLFDVAKAIEVVGGLMLLFNLFTPLGLAILLPVSAMVYFNATVLQGRWLWVWGEGGLYMGTCCLYMNLILMLAYIRYYVPMLGMRSSMGTVRDVGLLARIGGDQMPQPEPAATGRGRGLLAIAIGFVMCAAIIWQVSQLAPFTPSSGKTMRGMIGDYLEMAYDQGRGADAIAAYFAGDAVDHAPQAGDRVNGPPIRHRVERIVVDGMGAAVHHRIEPARGAPAMDVVDIYVGDRFSRIKERRRIVQPPSRE